MISVIQIDIIEGLHVLAVALRIHGDTVIHHAEALSSPDDIIIDPVQHIAEHAEQHHQDDPEHPVQGGNRSDMGRLIAFFLLRSKDIIENIGAEGKSCDKQRRYSNHQDRDHISCLDECLREQIRHRFQKDDIPGRQFRFP